MAMTYLTKLKPEPMGEYSLSTAYGVNSLVMSEDGAAAYISVKDVPAGTPLTNTEYWRIHTDLSAVKQSADAAAQKANAARAEMLEIARNLTDAVAKSGNPVQAELVGGLPFDRVATVLEPIQSGSGNPSPSNIRTISGLTGAKLTRCGKNLCPGIEIGLAYINADGSDYASSDYKRTKKIPITDGTIYSYSSDDGSLPNDIHFWDKNGNWLTVYNDGIARINNRPEGAVYMAFNYYQKGLSCVQVEIGSTYTAYEPYQGDTYTADFGQTVYGGTLNWLTGALTVEWGLISSYSGEALPGKWISDRDVYSAGATPTSGAQIAYKLATPQTIQLTPQEIKQLQGVNTLYGDGSISMTGRADKALALEARIAALEAAG